MALRVVGIWIGVTLAVMGGVAGAGASAEGTRPNFLVILCDDLGYGDLGCFGHPVIRTPNLDRLASDGMKLTDCYSAAPVCSPSRAGLLTGRNPNRYGVYDWISDRPTCVMYLNRREITVATLLRRAGYDTCHTGKWHCNSRFNSPEQPQPGDHGFNYWFSTQNNAYPSHKDPKNFVRNGTPVGRIEGYSCQIVADEAIRWLEDIRDPRKPFFLFVCFHEPHEPIASPPALVEQYKALGITEEGRALYYANVTNMDAAVGRLMRALDRLGLTENTLVWFTSDNGPETLNRYKGSWRSYGSPGPLRGRKLHVYEGGVRVPGILRWPDHTPPGRVCREPVGGVDVLPTLCAIAGVAVPDDRPIDGTSILPIFSGRPVVRKTPLFWFYYRALSRPKVALRDGPWKLLAMWDLPDTDRLGYVNPEVVRQIKRAALTEYELYNLKEDLGERHDVSDRYPERGRSLYERAVTLFGGIQKECPTWESAESSPRPASGPRAK